MAYKWPLPSYSEYGLMVQLISGIPQSQNEPAVDFSLAWLDDSIQDMQLIFTALARLDDSM